MNYSLFPVTPKTKPVKDDTPVIVCSSKRSVNEYIETRIRHEGLDWRCGNIFKTLAMPKPMAFFNKHDDFRF